MNDLKEHEKYLKGEPCSSEVHGQKIVKENRRTHKGPNSFICKFCDKTFSYMYQLRKHFRTHEKPYVCEICYSRFSEKSYLDNHHHKVQTEEKQFPFEISDKNCTDMNSLQNSILSHTRKTFTCETCNKNYSRKAHLMSHIRYIHMKQRDFKCSVCSKQFFNMHYLKIHLQCHTGATPFLCDFCNKSFTKMQSLKKHCITHTGEKPYVCDICNKKFSYKESLNKHFQTHEKRYLCEICNRKFTSMKSLVIHRRAHVKKMVYACELCDETFIEKSYLIIHFHNYHNQQKLLSDEQISKITQEKTRM